jgi:SRSO17 transposase
MTGMSLLEAPEARALLEDAMIEPGDVADCRKRIAQFVRRYLPLFYRQEQRENAALVIRGHLSGLERKTCEPIARAAGVERKPIQFFVGNGKWDDEAVMAELRAHVAEELADPEGVLVIDGSTFPKKGQASCGVGRQWCGRLGKVENCQTGVFLTYAAAGGHALVDRRLYLPKEWVAEARRRKKGHVPAAVRFQEKWRIGWDMIREHGSQLPHHWITGDDEFGRVNDLRRRLRVGGERYLLDVPCTTLVRDLERRRPPRRSKKTRRREVPFCRADKWAAQQPAGQWRRLKVRDGEKGPLMVEALDRRVQTKDEQRRLGPEERLVVIRTVGDEPAVNYCLCHADPKVPLSKLVRVHAARHRIEESLEEGKQEVGLGQYEVRSWVGWHHHMTLCLLALWFLTLQRRRIGEKKGGDHGLASSSGIHRLATPASAHGPTDRPDDHRGADTQRGNTHLQVACGHGPVSTTQAA